MICRGLQGGNPLGFLAAIGLLRATTFALQERKVTMRWTLIDGFWTPVVESDVDWDNETFAQALDDWLKKRKGNPALEFADNLSITTQEFCDVAKTAFKAASLSDRDFADYVVAFGSDVLVTDEKEPKIQDTALRTMSGAGHQHFLGFMRELVEKTDTTHLSAALFSPWAYEDEKPSMRWDPQDDRRYALRWKEPSGDPMKTVRGANRLAIEALPLFSTAPVGRILQTTGFTRTRRNGVMFTWPIWDVSLSLNVVRSLLALDGLQVNAPNRKLLKSMGVVEIYRSQRITQDKYRNFTPAVPA